jgi:hypothetical protein
VAVLRCQGLSLGSVVRGVRGGFGTAKGVAMILTYSLTCPVGIAVGVAMADSYDPESITARGVQVRPSRNRAWDSSPCGEERPFQADCCVPAAALTGHFQRRIWRHAPLHLARAGAPQGVKCLPAESCDCAARLATQPCSWGSQRLLPLLIHPYVPRTSLYSQLVAEDMSLLSLGRKGARSRLLSFVALAAGAGAMCLLAVWA